MKSKLNTYLIYIIALILIALITVLSFIVYKSYEYKAQTASLVAETALLGHQRTSISSIRAALVSAQSAVATIESRFIKETDVPDFISSIERLGVDNSVSINIVSVDLDKIEVKVPKKSEPKPTTPVVPPPRNLRMRIDGTGSWQQVIRFISALESRQSALTVQSMSLAKTVPPAERPQETWRFSADITQFVSN